MVEKIDHAFDSLGVIIFKLNPASTFLLSLASAGEIFKKIKGSFTFISFEKAASKKVDWGQMMAL